MVSWKVGELYSLTDPQEPHILSTLLTFLTPFCYRSDTLA